VVSATTVPPSKLREFGCAGYLPKPFAVPTLIEIVERHNSEAEEGPIAECPPQEDSMLFDLAMVALMAACLLFFVGLIWLCERLAR
jgi:hypothetical protein